MRVDENVVRRKWLQLDTISTVNELEKPLEDPSGSIRQERSQEEDAAIARDMTDWKRAENGEMRESWEERTERGLVSGHPATRTLPFGSGPALRVDWD